MIIGLTVIAIGTSAPEIFVAIMASFKGKPALSIGAAFGSNIANIGFVLATTAIFFPFQIPKDLFDFEYPCLLMASLLSFLLLLDHHLSPRDGFILIAAFITLLVTSFYRLKNKPPHFEDPSPQTLPLPRACFFFGLGVVLLPICSNQVVDHASDIAKLFGISDVVIGLTIISIGTSLPELAASIVGARKGMSELVMGNVIGSNLFNLLAVLPFPAIIHPADLPPHVLQRDIATMVALTLLVYLLAGRSPAQQPCDLNGKDAHPRLTRSKGWILFCCYLGYLTWIVLTH